MGNLKNPTTRRHPPFSSRRTPCHGDDAGLGHPSTGPPKTNLADQVGPHNPDGLLGDELPGAAVPTAVTLLLGGPENPALHKDGHPELVHLQKYNLAIVDDGHR